jgi:hypothetical protein
MQMGVLRKLAFQMDGRPQETSVVIRGLHGTDGMLFEGQF